MKWIGFIVLLLINHFSFSQTNLNQKLTTYFCNLLEVPNNGKYEITATIEQSANHLDKFVIGIKFDLETDNKIIEKFTLGSIGIGNTEEEALRTCIEEWVTYFCMPYKNYHLKETDLHFDNKKIYYSLLGVREDKPIEKILNEKERIKLLYDNIKKVGILNGNSVNTVLIFLSVNGEKIEGECRINGKISDTLTKSLIDSNYFVNNKSLTYTLKEYLIIE